MGIFDLYCKICGDPFYYPDEFHNYGITEEGEEDPSYLFPDDPEFKRLFDWIESNAVIYPDERVVKVGPYITNEGARAEGGYKVYPEPMNEYGDLEMYWHGLAVHMKCLQITQLVGANNYNRLYFDPTFTGDGACGENALEEEKTLCDYTQQEFRWEEFLEEARTSDIRYLIEDPDINERNRQRIIARGRYVASLPLTPYREPGSNIAEPGAYNIFFGPTSAVIQTPGGPVTINYTNKYTVEGILSAPIETIQSFATIFHILPTRSEVLRILKANDLVVGPYQEVINHPEFPQLAEMSVKELEREMARRNVKFHAAAFPKSLAIENILFLKERMSR